MKPETVAALEAVRQANDRGILLPKEVIAAAKDKNSPLHSEFTWDDKKAANKCREIEARQLIRAVVVYLPQVDSKCRGYLSIPTDRISGGGYRSTPEAIGDDNMRTALIEEVRQKLLTMKKSYSHLPVLQPLWIAVEQAVESLRQPVTEAA